MYYLFNNDVGFQRRSFLRVQSKLEKGYLLLEIGSLKEIDKTLTFQLIKEEISDLIIALTKISDENSSAVYKTHLDIEEAEIIT